MKRDPRSLVWDAREASDIILAATRGKDFADFDRDVVLRSAVERQFEIIGEALAQLGRLDPAMAERISERRAIIAFRNILIHGYAIIDRARVWRIVQDELPRLRAALNEIVGDA